MNKKKKTIPEAHLNDKHLSLENLGVVWLGEVKHHRIGIVPQDSVQPLDAGQIPYCQHSVHDKA
jgi:hypothetical protein